MLRPQEAIDSNTSSGDNCGHNLQVGVPRLSEVVELPNIANA